MTHSIDLAPWRSYRQPDAKEAKQIAALIRSRLILDGSAKPSQTLRRKVAASAYETRSSVYDCIVTVAGLS
jgi:hypothetical protein